MAQFPILVSDYFLKGRGVFFLDTRLVSGDESFELLNSPPPKVPRGICSRELEISAC